MPNLTTKQKIAIALSVPVAGILFYVLLKWVREDEEFSNETNVDDTEFVSSTDLVSEMTVQQCHVGAIIGSVIVIMIIINDQCEFHRKS